ncbi:hypothetical protein [Azospirillum largimobile]
MRASNAPSPTLPRFAGEGVKCEYGGVPSPTIGPAFGRPRMGEG